ncbi:MAG: thioredoxin [Gammaproteobacteria bacterium]|jgi:thioredoxin 1|uniref:Thioredoxin n=1 Tax=SAR86 cluster bacterium TaxID=2030880 RepID=A0A368BY49_9GAMM|nr:MAG: thioredoxin [SAR86 cluster bacterium]|tara:strand:- start:699 stop:1025 length:327 start_codon:yes stop_codon:yes gene_type:complete
MSNGVLEVSNDNFESEVVNSEKPVLVDFWAEWCGPCKQIAPVVEEIAGEHSDKLKVCKMDVDANRETAVQFGIRSIPTLLIFKNGEVAGSQIGAVSKQQLLEFIQAEI